MNQGNLLQRQLREGCWGKCNIVLTREIATEPRCWVLWLILNKLQTPAGLPPVLAIAIADAATLVSKDIRAVCITCGAANAADDVKQCFHYLSFFISFLLSDRCRRSLFPESGKSFKLLFGVGGSILLIEIRNFRGKTITIMALFRIY